MKAEFTAENQSTTRRESTLLKKYAPEKVSIFSLANAQLAYEGRVVLKNISFIIARGERVALVSKYGVGKSTLLAALREQHASGVAWCPQQHGLVPMLSVYHNIYMGGLHRHNSFYNLLNLLKPLSQPLGEVTDLAEQLQLDEFLFDHVEQLSGGQSQRVAIGRALYQQKNIFLGDEPVSAVDDYQAQQLLSLIVEKHETLVLALHDIEQALRFCDRIIGLKDSVIVLDAPTSGFKSNELAELYN